MVATLGYDIKVPSLGVIEPKIPERTDDILFVTGQEVSSQEAKAYVNGDTEYGKLIEKGYFEGKSLQTIQNEATELGIKIDEFQRAQDYYLEQGLLVNQEGVTAAEVRGQANLQRAFEMVTGQAGTLRQEQSGMGKFARGLEYVFSPLTTYDDLTKEVEAAGQEVLMKAVSLSPEEFSIWFKDYMANYQDRGLLNDTAMQLDTLARGIQGAGFDETADAMQLFTGMAALAGAVGNAKTVLGVAGRVTRKPPPTVSSAIEAEDSPFVNPSDRPQSLPPVRPVDNTSPNIFDGVEDEVANVVDGVFTQGDVQTIRTHLRGRGYDAETADRITQNLIKGEGEKFVVRTEAKAETKGTSFTSSNGPDIDPAARASRLIGPDAAGEGAAASLRGRYSPDTAGAAMSSTVRVQPQGVQVASAPFTREGVKSRILEALNVQRKLGRLGPEKNIEAEAQSIIDTVITQTRSSVVDHHFVMDDLAQTGRLSVRFGTSSGQVFSATTDGKVPETLKQIASDSGLKVIKADPTDPSKGFYLELDKVINNTEVATSVMDDYRKVMEEVAGINHNGWSAVGKLLTSPLNNPFVASSRVRDVEAIATSWQQIEGVQAYLKQVIKNDLKKLSKLSAREHLTLNRIIADLRDGPDSHMRQWYSDLEFQDKYRKYTGELPSDRVKEAYEIVVGISDADYVIKSNSYMQKGIKSGYNRSYQGSPIREVTTNKDVFDVKTNKVIKGDRAMGPVFKVLFPEEGGPKFVTGLGPGDIKPVKPQDFLGYNSGGPRTNPSANYFITVKGDGGRLRSLLTAATSKDAKLALEEINLLRGKLKDGTLDDDVIKRSNTFNPSIQTANDFKTFLKDIPDDAGIYVKERDGKLFEELDLDDLDDDFFRNITPHEFFGIAGKRQDSLLTHFGGGKGYQEDPMSNILAGFSKTEHAYTQRLVTYNAMKAWLLNAKNYAEFPAGVHDDDYFNMFLGAKVTSDTPEARKLKELQGILKRRLHIEDDAASLMNTTLMALSDTIWDLPGGKSFSRKIATLKEKDPASALLSFGFHTKMGFFSPDQMIMQAFHAVNIANLTMDFKSPWIGMKALNLLSHTKGKDPSIMNEAIKRMANYHGWKEEDMRGLVDFINQSGKLLVDGDAIELNTGISYGINRLNGTEVTPTLGQSAWYNTKKLATGVADAGLVFFKAGDRLSRVAAMATAYREALTKSGLRQGSPEFITYVDRKANDYLLNMDTGARARYQQGLWRIPTQWMSYGQRSYEALFLGKAGFTPGQRARFGLSQVMMFGAASAGVYQSGHYLAEKLGVEAGGSIYNYIVHGAISTIFNEMNPGEGPALDYRLGGFGLINDLYSKITEDNFGEIIGGASGGIAYDVFSDFKKVITAGKEAITNQNFGPLLSELLDTARSIKTVDNVTKAVQIWNNGYIRTRTGTRYDDIDSHWQAVTTALGFNSLEQQQQSVTQNIYYKEQAKIRDLEAYYRKEYDIGWSMIKEGKVEEAIQYFGYLRRQIDSLDILPQDARRLKNFQMTPQSTNLERIIRNGGLAPDTYTQQVARTIGE